MSSGEDNPNPLLKNCRYCGKEIKRSSHRCPFCKQSLADIDQLEWEQDISPDYGAKGDKTKSSLGAETRRPAFSLRILLLLIAVLCLILSGLEISRRLKNTNQETLFEASTAAQLAASSANSINHKTQEGQIHPPVKPNVKNDPPKSEKAPEENTASKDDQERIARLSKEIYADLKEKQVITPDTICLTSGKEIPCTIVDDSEEFLKISYRGLTTTIDKERVKSVRSKSPEDVEAELQELAIEQASRIVLEGLVQYGNEWITAEEREHRIQVEKIRLAEKKFEATRKAEQVRLEAAQQAQYDREYYRARTQRAKEETERKRIEAEKQIEQERIAAELIWLQGGTKVRLIPTGTGGHIVPVQLQGTKHRISASLKLDTGCDMTTISTQVAVRLGLARHTSGTFKVADGRSVVRAIAYLPEIAVQGEAVRNLEVAIGDTGGYTDGLLGMDFLHHFEFEIDTQKNVLVLRSRRP